MNAEQITKLKELAQAASIDLPVEHDDYSSIRSKTGNFVVYDEGGATEEQARYVVELINLAPELIAAAERTTSPVSQMTDEQAWEVIKAEQGTQVTDWRGRTAIVIESPSEAGDVVRAILAAAAPHAQAPAAQQESIDTPEFQSLLIAARLYGDDPTHYTEGKNALVAHIDAHTAAAVAKAREEGRQAGFQQALTQSKPLVDKLRAEAALDQPVDLSKLHRIGLHSTVHGACTVWKDDGEYVRFADVEQLLAAAPAAPYPTRECEIGISIIHTDYREIQCTKCGQYGLHTCNDAQSAEHKPNADCSGDPMYCPDNEGYGCACDPMNRAASTKKGGA